MTTEGTVNPEPQTPQNVEQPIKEPETPQEKPQLTEEYVKQLIAEERKAMQEESQKTYKGIQRVVAQKDKEIQTLKGQLSNPQGNVTGFKELLDAVEKGDADSLARAKQVIAQAEMEANRNKQLQYQERVIGERQNEFNDLIEKAGLEADDPRLTPYELAFELAKQTGDFEVPKKTLTKILKTVTPPPVKEEKKEPTINIEEEVEKRLKQRMIEEGLLKSDTGVVNTGNPRAVSQALDDYISGKISADEARKRGVTFT